MNPLRIRPLNNITSLSGSIIYWMSRDQRILDNWAFFAAYKKALEAQANLIVIFIFSENFPGANLRAYDFLIKGLQEIENSLKKLNIPFHILIGEPAKKLSEFCTKNNISAIYTDFDPLKIKRKWKAALLDEIKIPVFEVDAHNIVPCWLASNKQEFSAKTLRTKIKQYLNSYLDEFPEIVALPHQSILQSNDWKSILKQINPDSSVNPVKDFIPGYTAGMKVLNDFITTKLSNYSNSKNNPNSDVLSNLSPYLHFGHISAQRVVIEILKNSTLSSEEFLEEIIIRRELSDNYCFYNPNYDNLNGAPSWALRTLEKHRFDKREFCYSLKIFENAQTHDSLWNAAQKELTLKGKMHGYMRMYWAKKILEWSESPELALETAIYLNDKYSLDGRDPNGYVGCLWSIAGLHDRPWKERPIFGMIRYMNRNGCERKFNTKAYIQKN